MLRNTLTAALALAAMGLSACGDRYDGMSNPKICGDFKTAAAAQTGAPVAAPSDAATPVDECVRRWAYSLAGSRDSADIVAEAAVSACSGALTRWNQAGVNQQAQAESAPPEQALSLLTGQPTNPFAEHSAFAHGRALLYVVQARAGRCAPPPAANGAPAGTGGGEPGLARTAAVAPIIAGLCASRNGGEHVPHHQDAVQF